MRAHRYSLRLASCFLFVAASTAFVRAVPGASRILWLANGVWLAFLLMAPRRRHRLALLGVGFAAQFAASLLMNMGWFRCSAMTTLNFAEVVIAAHLLRRNWTGLPSFTNSRYVLRFLVYAVLVAPVGPGLVCAVCEHVWLHMAAGPEFANWVVVDGLGTMSIAPACIALFRSSLMRPFRLKKNWAYVLAIPCVYYVLSQTGIPFTFLLYPLLVLILLRMGLAWASLAALASGLVADWDLLRGTGPFVASAAAAMRPSMALQLFIASAMSILYGVWLVLEKQHVTERRLQRVANLHRLMTENSRDVIIVADFNGNRKYVSASAEGFGGWTREDILNRKSLSTVHPEDRAQAAEAILRLRTGADNASVECRALAKSGSYCWAEVGMRTIRDPRTREPMGILENVRDITDRKQSEKKLQDAYRAVEALAVTDSLTGLANRRRFDRALVTEWRRGMRERSPLSLLMIDADKFKLYNDTYGHLRGDSCLKQIAEAALDAVCRPGDLIARFGGEECAVLLPGTNAEGALHLAEEICAGVRRRNLPHKHSPAGIVTVSIGCATLVPQLGQNSAHLVKLADEALYRAKKTGRNRVCHSLAEPRNPRAAAGVHKATIGQLPM